MGLLLAVFIDQHCFEAQGPGRYLMHDTIIYQWDLSWWGCLVSEAWVRLYLTLL